MDILYVDMDGVIADFKGGIAKLDPTLDIGDHPHEWSEREQRVDLLCYQNPNIFSTLDVIEGSQEAIDLLSEVYDIYFLSTPMWNLPESYSDKRRWIAQHFPTVSYKKLILTHHKHLVMGKYLVDDRKMNGVDKFTGHHIHFGTIQFPNWKVVTNYLMGE